MAEEINSTVRTSRRSIAEALLGYSLFCLLSIGSRIYASLWLVVIVFGFAYPMMWSRLTRIKPPERIHQKSTIASVGWGTLTGVIFSAYCVVSQGAWGQFPPPFPALQMTIGTFAFAAVLSPFQELFFRAWLQPRLEGVGGPFNSAVLTSLLFMFWHWLPPFSESGGTSLNVISLPGSISTFLLGMACGVAYWRTRRLLAPWLAHTIAGATITALGKVSFLQMIE
ncbi:MAG: CPBP family intramembrane metalloprotease [Candidatus Bathyarchaeota archaeon]|nr:CPBP family intramembrane metalloprotease [Candidatus Bathyarchaeota archaeon]